MLKVQYSVQFKETVWHATEYLYRLHLRGKQNYEQANEKSRRTPEAGHKFSTMKIKVYFFTMLFFSMCLVVLLNLHPAPAIARCSSNFMHSSNVFMHTYQCGRNDSRDSGPALLNAYRISSWCGSLSRASIPLRLTKFDIWVKKGFVAGAICQCTLAS